MLKESSFAPDGSPLCIYGDPAYPLRVHLQTGFNTIGITPEEDEYNQRMSASRVSVEWVFGDIVKYFAFCDFKKNLKVGLSPIGKIYVVSALLQNIHCCLYGSNTSRRFECQPPILEEYLVEKDV